MLNLTNALKEFTYIYDKATANHVLVFAYIAHQDAIGRSVLSRDLPDALGLTQTTINRTIRTMADRSYLREDGFKLLKIYPDPTDERQRVVELTKRGRMLVEKMKGALYNGKATEGDN